MTGKSESERDRGERLLGTAYALWSMALHRLGRLAQS